MLNRLYIDRYVFEYEGLYLPLRGENIKDKCFIIFIKNNENLEIFCLQLTCYLNTRTSFPICMLVVMASGICYLHIHFTFLQEFSPAHIWKKLIFFRIMYSAMFSNQYSALDDVKMTCKRISTKVFFIITIRKYMFTLTLVDLEYNNSLSIWEFEMMILLKW